MAIPYQLEPHHVCQNRIATFHCGHKCSIPCRGNWARLNARLLFQQLVIDEDLFLRDYEGFYVYFGNVGFNVDLQEIHHTIIRSRFLRALRTWMKKSKIHIKFRAVAEIGFDRRMHYHYCCVASNPVSQPSMKNVWDAACPDIPTIISHRPPQKPIVAAVKYMHKDLTEVHEKRRPVLLFHKYSPPISWGTRGFFYPSFDFAKKIVWKNQAVQLAFS